MIPPTHDNEILNKDVRWGEFKIGDLFELKPTKNYGLTNDYLFQTAGSTPVLTNTSMNNGISGYVDLTPTEKGNAITFSDTTTVDGVFYQPCDFIGYSHIQVMRPLKYTDNLNAEIYLYIITAFKKATVGLYNYGSKFNRENAEKTQIFLPVTCANLPDFDYMETYIKYMRKDFVALVEAYLTEAGLIDCELNSEEQEILAFEPQWGEFRVEDLFDTIKRGKRIKSLDRINGNLPFITAGTGERGFSSYIGNPEAEIFPENSLTIDMFGTVFYRGYEYGADDHVAVLYNEAAEYSKEVLIYMGACIEKSISGKFSYSRNFYASDAYDVVVLLPKTKNETPDFVYMESYINANKKLATANKIRGFDLKINAAKYIIQKRV